MSGDFLSRWSRRKLGEEPVAEPEISAGEAPEIIEPSEGASAGGAPPDGDITEEEIAALPPVESLDAASDIAGFLRKGVPLALRNAALRRVWAADPAIRDFIGHARDYDWNWNIAGGVPVSGPLSPGTDVAAMLRNIMGGAKHEPQAPAAPPVIEETVAHTAPAPEPAPVRRPVPQGPVDEAPPETEDAGNDEASPEEPARVRGHGGAMPA